MGTRCLTVFTDKYVHKGKNVEEEIVVMYRQMDGYPTGHGQDLKDFLSDFVIVNGLSSDQPEKIANGMGCLSAQVIAHFKEEPGNIYLYPAKTRDCGEEYIYTIYPAEERDFGPTQKGIPLNIRIQSGCMTAFGLPGTKQCDMDPLYDGPISEFVPEWVEKREQKLKEDGGPLEPSALWELDKKE